MRRIVGVIALVMLLMPVQGLPAVAQNVGVVQSDILVLDPERLFADTQLGQRVNAEYQAEREKLIARNLTIQAELEAEELALTNLRSEKTPAEFRLLADEFDTKVQEIRRDSERAIRDLERSRERAPVMFMRQVEPVLIQVMRDTGGAVIMDVRSVLLRANVIDITDLAITRVDATIGNGLESNLPEATNGNTQKD